VILPIRSPSSERRVPVRYSQATLTLVAPEDIRFSLEIRGSGMAPPD